MCFIPNPFKSMIAMHMIESMPLVSAAFFCMRSNSSAQAERSKRCTETYAQFSKQLKVSSNV